MIAECKSSIRIGKNPTMPKMHTIKKSNSNCPVIILIV